MKGRATPAIRAALSLLLAGCSAEQSRPADVVLIVIDTLRRDHLSVYGGTLPTPNVERLAARGRVEELALSSFHQTTMSMASLFTGRTPSLETGRGAEALPFNQGAMYGLARFAGPDDGERYLPAAVSTLAEVMREAGYWTVGVASNPLTFRPVGFDRGFERWVEVGELVKTVPAPNPQRAALTRTGERVNAAVLDELRERPEQPLFLYVHYMDVHDYPMRKRSYAEAVIAADRALGALLEQLETHGLSKDALLVLTSDHGERLEETHLLRGLPTHGGNPSFETLLRVPLILVGAPATDASGTLRSDDVFRLLAGFVGRPQPPPDLEPDEVFVSEFLFRTYQRGRFKSFWRRGDGAFFLVDLERDPGERVDVSAGHPEVVVAHRARIEALSQSLAAPGEFDYKLDPVLRERLRILGYVVPD